MAAITLVKSARKPQGKCRVCGNDINVGDSYKWAHPRYHGKVVVCSNCQITQSMLSSSKMVACWEAQEAISRATIDELADELRSAADTAREVGEEYQEACDNQREYFPDSAVAEENEERANNLEDWARELESAADEVENLLSEITKLKDERSDLETELQGLTDEERGKYISDRVDEIEILIENNEQEAFDSASNASDSCPA